MDERTLRQNYTLRPDEMKRSQAENELLSTLQAMGYPTPYARRALSEVDATFDNATALVFHWMEENPIELFPHLAQEEKHDSGIKLRVVRGKSQPRQPVAVSEGALTSLTNMGFSRLLAKEALKHNDNDLQASILWILQKDAAHLEEQIRETNQGTVREPGCGEGEGEGMPEQGSTRRYNIDYGTLKSAVEKQAEEQGKPAANADEVSAMTDQIAELQQLVLTYQTKFLDLKKKLKKGAKAQSRPPARHEAKRPTPAPVAAVSAIDEEEERRAQHIRQQSQRNAHPLLMGNSSDDGEPNFGTAKWLDEK